MLPPVFAKIHPKYCTPHINTVITGVGIAALAAVFPLDVLGDLVSMGTLIAFCAVCIGVLILRKTQPDAPRTFRVPFAPVVCTLGVLSCLFLLGGFLLILFVFGVSLGIVAACLSLVFNVSNVVQMSYRIALIPDELQGRVNGLFRLVSFIGMPIGTTLAGVLLQVSGIGAEVAFGAAWFAVLAVVAAASGEVRRARITSAQQAA